MSITVIEANKSFGAVCTLEGLQEVVLGNSISNKYDLIQLSFTAVRVINSENLEQYLHPCLSANCSSYLLCLYLAMFENLEKYLHPCLSANCSSYLLCLCLAMFLIKHIQKEVEPWTPFKGKNLKSSAGEFQQLN